MSEEKPWKREATEGDEAAPASDTTPTLTIDPRVISDSALRAEMRHLLAALETACTRIAALETRVANLERAKGLPVVTGGTAPKPTTGYPAFTIVHVD